MQRCLDVKKVGSPNSGCISVSISPSFSFPFSPSLSSSIPFLIRSSLFLTLVTAKSSESSWKKAEGGFVKQLLEYWFGYSDHQSIPSKTTVSIPSQAPKDEGHNSPIELLKISNNLPKHILISLLRNLALTRVLLTTIKSVRSMTIKIGCPIPFFAVTVLRTYDIVVGEIGVFEEGEVFWVCVSGL
jgi:hypothetical protein